MERWSLLISVVSGLSACIGFVGIFVKLGREKGESDAIQKEMRKDIDSNAKDINSLGSKVNSMQIENTKLITTLSNDLGWIKSSLMDIKNEISKTK
jgi:hypothetical protein